MARPSTVLVASFAAVAIAAAGIPVCSAATRTSVAGASGPILSGIILVVLTGVSLLAGWLLARRRSGQRLKLFASAIGQLARGDAPSGTVGQLPGEAAEAVTLVEALCRSRQSYRRRLAELEAIIEGLPVCFLLSDGQNRIVRLSRRAAETIGVRFEEARGASLRELLPAVAEVPDGEDPEGAGSGEPGFGAVERFRTTDGRERWVRIERVPLTALCCDDRSMLVVWSDATRQKQLEEELAGCSDALREAREQLQQFVYIASHDLQEPLRIITGYCDLLERRFGGELRGDGREFIAFAVEGARRMQKMINDLLEYSRAGSVVYAVEPIDLNEVMETVRHELADKIAESGVRIEAGVLPRVNADKIRITTVFRHLVGNAIKFNDSDPPRVSIGARDAGADVEISIRDNGIGVDPKFSEHIFEVFRRLHGREDYDGSGIGLPLARRIVERHGGSIALTGSSREGSTFSLTLPRSDVASRGQ